MWLLPSPNGTQTPTPAGHLSALSSQLRTHPSEPCFAQTASRFALGTIPLATYLSLLFAHLGPDPPRHTFDTSDDDIPDLFWYDLVGGAVKATVQYSRKPKFSPRSESEIDLLIKLCVALWDVTPTSDSATPLSELGLDAGGLSSLSVGVAAMVCYARRLPLTLSRLLRDVKVKPPATTVFDCLPRDLPLYRARMRTFSGVTWWEHVPPSSRDGDVELQLWSILKAAKWLHGEVDTRLGQQTVMAEMDRKSPARLSTDLEEMARRAEMPTLWTLDRFLAGGCTVAQAERLFALFPLKRLQQEGGYTYDGPVRTSGGLNLPGILVTVADWPGNNPDRVAVTKLILDQGVDPNSREPDYGGISSVSYRGMPLHAASRNGDVELVKVLLERGARDDIRGREGLFAVEMAREGGHEEVVRLLEEARERNWMPLTF